MNMETTTTAHPLRTMTLRFDRSKTAPEFETLALRYYHEIHDRAHQLLQRIQQGRTLVPGFRNRMETLEWLFEQATYKFNHLKKMIPSNPLLDTVRSQLNALLAEMDDVMAELVPELIDETGVFFNYEEDSVAADDWMNNTAFPQFQQVISNWEVCSVDLVFFDLDLEDFKYALAFVRKQEGHYFDEMNTLIEDYTDLSHNVELLFSDVSDFDETLVIGL